MKQKHLFRTNKVILIIHCVTALFLCAGLAAQLTLSELEPVRSIVPLGMNILIIVAGIIVFALYRNTFIYARYVAIAFSVLYVVLLLTAESNAAFPYMLPILMAMMLTLNQTNVLIAGITFGAANIIRIILTVSAADSVNAVMESVMIEFIVMVLGTLAAIRGVRLINHFFDDFSKEAENYLKNSNDVNKKIVEVAGAVENEIHRAGEGLGQIRESTDLAYRAMQEISTGTMSNKETVFKQNEQTQSIQKIIDSTYQRTNQMTDIADEANGAISESLEAMQKLLDNVNIVIQDNGSMRQAAGMLSEQSNQVRGITDIIIGISSQTNLLALNASIEAARAGDSGKGFAVVADEIRNLAEQTRRETENITKLLDELMRTAQDVAARVEKNVAISKEENDLATLTDEKLVKANEKINSIAESMEQINLEMNELRGANNQIVESVSVLSSNSEEISASSQEACRMSENNKKLVEDFAENMKQIQGEVAKLQEYGTQN